jgi:hypothetical protein
MRAQEDEARYLACVSWKQAWTAALSATAPEAMWRKYAQDYKRWLEEAEAEIRQLQARLSATAPEED